MKKLVVIGGGFSGSKVAKNLESEFDLTLIDTKDYFEFTPSILKVIVEPSYIDKINVEHKRYLKKANVIVSKVIDLDKSYVYLDNGQKIHYDYLLISSGSSYSLPIKEQNVVLANRAKNLYDSYKKLILSKDIVIVGGGLVGIELALEIATRYKDKRVKIIDSGSKILERNLDKTSKIVTEYLKKNNIDLVLNRRVVDVYENEVILNDNTKIKSDLTFLCTGIHPNFEFMKNNFNDKIKHNKIVVDEYLRVSDNIFCAGDVNSVLEEKTAQGSESQAKIVISNLLALKYGKRLIKYKVRKRPFVISLGKNRGIFERSFTIFGVFPAILKKFIEFKTMFKYKYL